MLFGYFIGAMLAEPVLWILGIVLAIALFWEGGQFFEHFAWWLPFAVAPAWGLVTFGAQVLMEKDRTQSLLRSGFGSIWAFGMMWYLRWPFGSVRLFFETLPLTLFLLFVSLWWFMRIEDPQPPDPAVIREREMRERRAQRILSQTYVPPLQDPAYQPEEDASLDETTKLVGINELPSELAERNPQLYHVKYAASYCEKARREWRREQAEWLYYLHRYIPPVTQEGYDANQDPVLATYWMAVLRPKYGMRVENDIDRAKVLPEVARARHSWYQESLASVGRDPEQVDWSTWRLPDLSHSFFIKPGGWWRVILGFLLTPFRLVAAGFALAFLALLLAIPPAFVVLLFLLVFDRALLGAWLHDGVRAVARGWVWLRHAPWGAWERRARTEWLRLLRRA